MLLTLLAIVWLLIWLLAVVDIVRRRDLRTSSKVLWALAVIFVPVVGVLVYLVARPADARQYVPRTATRFKATLPMRASATATRSDPPRR
jgi:hypothetical protein